MVKLSHFPSALERFHSRSLDFASLSHSFADRQPTKVNGGGRRPQRSTAAAQQPCGGHTRSRCASAKTGQRGRARRTGREHEIRLSGVRIEQDLFACRLIPLVIMDFDDLFSEPTPAPVRVGRKFQPKAKPPARVVSTAVAKPSVAETTDQPVAPASTLSDKANDLLDKKLDAPVSSAVASVEVSGTQSTSLNNEAVNLGALSDYNAPAPAKIHIDDVPSAVAASMCNVDCTSNFLQSTGENADISPGLSFDDVSDRSTALAGNEENAEGNYVLRNIPSCASNAGAAAFPPETSSKEDVIFGGEDVLLEIEDLETEDPESLSCPELLDIACEVSANSGKRAVKFHPKPKPRDKRTDVVDIVSLPEDTSVVLSEAQAQYRSEDNQVLGEPHDPDFPSVRFDDALSMDPSAGCLLNQVPKEPFRVSQPDDVVSDDVHLQSVPSAADLEVQLTASQSCQEEEFASTANDGNQSHKYSSKLRKRKSAQEFTGGSETMAYDAGEPLNGSLDEVVDADENYKDGHDDEEISRKKRTQRKSKKDATENNKPTRKRKKKAEAPAQSDKQPPKKLPHSTRRKKRTVDKSFLEMPDNEIDFQRVPLRDLIIRADIKQRQANKESATVNPPMADERADHTMQDNPVDDYYNQAFTSDQGRDTYNNPSSSNVPINDGDYYNYHTFMDRTPTVRWSKQDTELFYKAVSQFGSDFSMIQQLFPDRTRHQIKLKYKKEERQHPMRLFDALTSKAKDLSHFEQVIEKLQEQAGQEEMSQGTHDDEDGAESNQETHEKLPMEGTGKSEKKEESTGADEGYGEDFAGSDDDIDYAAIAAYKAAFG
ncbi:hypothetical protein Dimus_028126 [Dionaea muscipula]